ncbi:MAG: cytochrome c oxidase assembly protein [Acidimicrobiales bacterium]
MMLAHGDPTASPLTPHLHPDVVAFVAVLVLAYWLALTRLGPRVLPPGEPAWSRRQAGFLVAGIAALWAFSDWPVHDLAEGYLYSVHMLQHSVYTLVLPPLFILGTPPWLWRWLLRPVMGLFRQLVRPWAAVLVFSAVTVATHLPSFVTAAVRSGPAHFAQHTALVLASVLVWWPLLGPLPEAPRLSAPVHQMVYVFAQSLVPSVVGSSLIWAQGVPYRVYEEFPRLWGIDALDDQQWAGTIMEVVEGSLIIAMVSVVFLRMVRNEQRSPNSRTDRPGRVPSSAGLQAGMGKP